MLQFKNGQYSVIFAQMAQNYCHIAEIIGTYTTAYTALYTAVYIAVYATFEQYVLQS